MKEREHEITEIWHGMQLLALDIWEGITTFWPEYRDAETPLLSLIFDEPGDKPPEDRLPAYYIPPQPDDLNEPVITFNLGHESIPQQVPEIFMGCEPLMAHELTHHLQYLRGEGGYGSRGPRQRKENGGVTAGDDNSGPEPYRR